jgi:hypothetical protein
MRQPSHSTSDPTSEAVCARWVYALVGTPGSARTPAAELPNDVSASALWVNFDVHETVTVTMDHFPGAVLSPVDRRRSQPHFLRLTVEMPSEPLKLDCETERIVGTGGEILRAPGFVVQRFGCCGQELAHLVKTNLVTANASHERNVFSVRPQFKKRPRITAGMLPEGVMTPLDELEELGSVCIRSTCRRLHNFLLLLLQKFCRGLDPFVKDQVGLGNWWQRDADRPRR